MSGEGRRRQHQGDEGRERGGGGRDPRENGRKKIVSNIKHATLRKDLIADSDEQVKHVLTEVGVMMLHPVLENCRRAKLD